MTDDETGTPLDWSDVRRRLAVALDADAAEDARKSRERANLLNRTRALAVAHALPEALERTSLLVFRRGSERFGVPLVWVLSAYVDAHISAIPGADAPTVGLVSWRNRPLTVYDPAAGAAAAFEPNVALIVVGDAHRAAGLIADEIEDVVRDVGGLDAPDADETAASARVLHPLARSVTSDAIVVIDANRVLTLFVEHS